MGVAGLHRAVGMRLGNERDRSADPFFWHCSIHSLWKIAPKMIWARASRILIRSQSIA
jgi:hypothetical protein